jgi:ubiquinone/menaquinone biosynthesis C-methylase UbiE
MGGQSGGNGSGAQPLQAVDRYASENGRIKVGEVTVSCFPDGKSAAENAMTEKTHARLVTDQFGPQAAAYVASSVHAQGEDLDALEAMVAGQRSAHLLDLGCGGGHVSFRVAPHVAQVTAYDLSAHMLGAVAKAAAERGLTNVATRQGTVERLPFGDSSFDFVCSRYSAHHWHDFTAALSESRRVLKDDGRAVFMDSVSPGPALLDTYLQAIELLRDPSHVRDYSIPEWIRSMTSAGFLLEKVVRRRVRLEFAAWIVRMRTPEIRVQAIRSLQKEMSSDVTKYFAIEEDGSFMLDTMSLEAVVA